MFRRKFFPALYKNINSTGHRGRMIKETTCSFKSELSVFAFPRLVKWRARTDLTEPCMYIGVSIREPEEHFKLKNNVGMRTNEY